MFTILMLLIVAIVIIELCPKFSDVIWRGITAGSKILINSVPEASGLIWRTIVASSTIVRNLIRNYGVIPLRSLYRWQFFIIAGLSILFLLALQFEWETLAIVTTWLAAGVFFLNWFAFSTIVKIISGISLFRIREEKRKEILNFLSPVLTTALIYSFLGALVSIKGVEWFVDQELLVAGSVAIFFALFYIFFPLRKRILQISMMVVIVILVLTNKVFPVQAQAVIGLIERSSIEVATSLDKKNPDGQIVLIPVNCALYDENIKKINITSYEFRAKVLGHTEDRVSKEPLYEVVLEEYGSFVGGPIVYVEKRAVHNIISPGSDSASVKNVSYNYNIPDKFPLIHVEGGDTVVFNSPLPFSFDEISYPSGRTNRIRMPSGESRRFFKYEGSIETYEDIRGITAKRIPKK